VKSRKIAVHVPPPSPLYVLSEYERGMLDALEIMTQARQDLSAPLRHLNAGVASGLVSAASHLIDTVVAEVEKRVQRRLGELVIAKRDAVKP
jgi:hypothetical protein